jgi:hypothetical protein
VLHVALFLSMLFTAGITMTPGIFARAVGHSVCVADYLSLAWLTASIVTVGGRPGQDPKTMAASGQPPTASDNANGSPGSAGCGVDRFVFPGPMTDPVSDFVGARDGGFGWSDSWSRVSLTRRVDMQNFVGIVGEPVRREAAVHAAITHLIQNLRAEVDDHQGSIWGLMTAAAMKLSAVQNASIVRVGQADAIRTLASTDCHLQFLNKLQQSYRQGPSLDAAWEGQVRRVDDLTSETRWPIFSDKAVAITSIRSMLCVPLLTHHHGRTALNLYADRPSAFGPEDELIGLAFASDAEAVLEVGRRAERYRQAQTNRELVGLAKGILMERFDVDAVTAFSLLAQLSKERRQPVSMVARGLVSTGSEQYLCSTATTRVPANQFFPALSSRTMSEDNHAGLDLWPHAMANHPGLREKPARPHQ